jgi:3-hydroxybutyrate dehydrogenase
LIRQQIVDLASRMKVSMEQAARELVGAKQPSKTFVQPQQLAQLVVFLCSNAASQITGAAIPMDGAWTAQ